MTFEECNWRTLSLSDEYFMNELRRELGQEADLFRKICAVAKSDYNDDVLYLLHSNKNAVYRIYHLTYSGNNAEGYPEYQEFADIKAVRDYIESQFISNQ